MRRDAWDDWVPPSRVPIELVPLFPITQFTPHAGCPHRKPMPEYTRLVCMCCHCTGAIAEAKAAKDDRGPRPDDEQDQRPPAKFRPKGTPPCEPNSAVRGVAARSTPGTSRGRSGGKSSVRGGRSSQRPDAPTS